MNKEDLINKAAEEYARKVYNDFLNDPETFEEKDGDDITSDAFKAGVEWRDKQALKVSNNTDEVARKKLDTYKPVATYSTSNGEPIEYYSSGQMRTMFKAGVNWRDNNLWHPADGDYLPELEREVVVFTQKEGLYPKVGIAHRPDPKGWDGRNILTGEVNHYTPKTYGKGGWSIPDVKIWLDCPMPYKEGGEE